MDTKQFNKINRIIAACVAVLASLVYLATIEPTTSFWDCGEFIASSYKLEVGHAPGNPVFNSAITSRSLPTPSMPPWPSMP